MGIFGKRQQVFSDEILRASIFMTLIQALSMGRNTPAASAVDRYSKLFSAIVSKSLKDGLISNEIFESLKYSPYEIEINMEDYELFEIKPSDSPLYINQGVAISNVLSKWSSSYSVTNADQNQIFSALVAECKNLGMSSQDEELIGLLFLDSVFFTTVLKDSQNDRVNCERMRSIGTFFATEMPNRWLIEKKKGKSA